jgi:hypothetical protein
LWFTAANVYILFIALVPHRGEVGIPSPPDEVKYGYGIGKETLLTPEPWIYGALFLIHLLFAGTTVFAQWTERGTEIVVDALGWYVYSVIGQIRLRH